MKLSGLRPCICCGGKIVPLFHMITIVDQVGALDRKATNEVLGLTQMLGGIGNAGAFAIAECMSPGTDDAVKVLGEGREPEDATYKKDQTIRVFVCNDCYNTQPSLDLREIKERARLPQFQM